jgi:TRAP-type mannitol/chloroaromatic compound transport system permease small subunit
MKTALLKMSGFIDRSIDHIGQLFSWISLLLVLLICIDVFMRYFLNTSKIWMVELEWHLFSVLFLMGASYTLLHDRHVRVDLFYENYSPKRKRIVNALGVLIFIIPWCLIILTTSWDYTLNSFSFREGSPQPGGLPARYIVKSFIFTGYFLLLIQAVSVLIRSIVPNKSE